MELKQENNNFAQNTNALEYTHLLAKKRKSERVIPEGVENFNI